MTILETQDVKQKCYVATPKLDQTFCAFMTTSMMLSQQHKLRHTTEGRRGCFWGKQKKKRKERGMLKAIL